jgi:hypothetical protein
MKTNIKHKNKINKIRKQQLKLISLLLINKMYILQEGMII